MLKELIAFLYEQHDRGIKKKNLVSVIHRKLFGSRFLFEALFKVRILSHWEEKGDALSDLTTVLLQHELKKIIRDKKNLKLFEFGVGSGIPLSGYFSRFTDHPVVACDINPQIVSIARKNIEANNLNIQVYVSDVFGSIPEQDLDVLWWNLPYYEDPETYLSSLFNDAPRFMTFKSILAIGFNTKPLSVEKVTGILGRYPSLEIKGQVEYWWNNHSVILIQLRQREAS